MKELTNEQFEQLTPFEHYFDTAINNDYVRAMPRQDAVTLARIYKELGYGTANLSCGKCILSMCKTLGNLYSSKKESHYGKSKSNQP